MWTVSVFHYIFSFFFHCFSYSSSSWSSRHNCLNTLYSPWPCRAESAVKHQPNKQTVIRVAHQRCKCNGRFISGRQVLLCRQARKVFNRCRVWPFVRPTTVISRRPTRASRGSTSLSTRQNWSFDRNFFLQSRPRASASCRSRCLYRGVPWHLLDLDSAFTTWNFKSTID